MTIDPRDIITRYSVEELCATSEEYFRRIPDATPLMTKPFAFLHETPEMLQNLGLLLSGLHLGRTMTVLDFGAGTCWLTRFLAQLNCRPIACDASTTALAIGRRLVDEHPPIGTAVYRPTFLPFDGHRIDLPDASVDRIVCFDAFHHVPNTREVLSEMGRVLVVGGIAGFSEPGRDHSRSPQSQYEMAHHRVLENDIDLNAIFAEAQPAGFTALTVKVIADMEISLDDYNRIYDGRENEPLRAEIWNQTYNTMFNRSVFFLHKGPLRFDSRSHVGLAHELTVAGTVLTVRGGEALPLQFTLRNTGTAAWLNTNSEIFGIVRLGSHLFEADGRLISIDHSRHDLPRPVEPGEALDLRVEVPLPAAPARYRLVFDLVAEGVAWFENLGSKTVEVTAVVV
jgi:SAM-dependent methyltransferase